MTATETIVLARLSGVTLARAGGRLRYEAPTGRMTPTLKKALLDQKTAILELLEQEADGKNLPPANLAPVAARVCLWRLPGNPVRHMVADPDHDLR